MSKSKVFKIPENPPICPNCGSSMRMCEPDEFFNTYAYYCDYCGIRTKECDSPLEAYNTIIQRG